MEHTLTVNTTARYHTLGKIHKDVKALWFVFHGYGMRCDQFIKEFDCIADSKTLIVAPEGLHRFYSRGFKGEICSSWMTSDLRNYDIINNRDFLNGVLKGVFDKGLPKDVQIGVLGFSQGAPTAIRWAMSLDVIISELVVWGSNVPDDVVNNIKTLKKLNESNVKLIIGSKDEYLPEEKVDELIMDLHDKGVDYDFHSFEGKHELHEDSIRYFHARLVDDNLEY
ncbi:MAG: putative esterase [Salibacteraceae bacterium]|jgi:predicted esterase